MLPPQEELLGISSLNPTHEPNPSDPDVKQAELACFGELVPIACSPWEPFRQQRRIRHLGVKMWINLQKVDWQRYTAPN